MPRSDPLLIAPSRPAAATPLEQQRESLGAYLRLLWNVSPPLLRAWPASSASGGARMAEPPFLSALGLHLPAVPANVAGAQATRDWYKASAAHAAAHLVYSRVSFDREALAPITQALIGVLEDARVESLACRELPGLRRLWLASHGQVAADGDGVEDLLLRLSRALLDPLHDDPHPWVRKGRGLLFHDAGCEVLALRRPEELRHAASLLGNDLGQMRLGFDVRSYQPRPSYRDDNRWLWRAAALDPAQAPPSSIDIGHDEHAPTLAEPPGEPAQFYPEWDRLIGRLRPAWCTTRESTATPDASARLVLPASDAAQQPALAHLLRQARSTLRTQSPRQREGDDIDLDAMLDARLASRIGQPADGRLYRRALRSLEDASVLLLIDSSASSALPFGRTGTSRLDAARRVAALLARGLQRSGCRFAIEGFSSDGRHDVRFTHVKAFDEAWAQAGESRLAGLRSARSTRLGTALRHGSRMLAVERGRRRWIIVISDGEPHDVDVHDPRYLTADARHAVRAAAREGIVAACLGLGESGEMPARSIFGARRCEALSRIEALPSAMRRLLG